MEAALQDIESQRKAPAAAAAAAASTAAIDSSPEALLLQALASALQAALPILSSTAAVASSTTATTTADTSSSSSSSSSAACPVVSAAWLMQLLETVQSQLGTSYLAQQIVQVANISNDDEASQQQAALFDILGESEAAMNVLFEIMPHIQDISKYITLEHLVEYSNNNNNNSLQTQTSPLESATLVDLEVERREFLLREAMDAAQVAAIAEAEVQALQLHVAGGPSSLSSSAAAATSATVGGTHTITRTSEKQAIKFLEKSKRRAQQAMQRAKDAGAILDDSDLIKVNTTGFGTGGLAGMMMHDKREAVWAALQSSLLPKGSKQYYDSRGLPRGTIQSDGDGYIKIWIPPAQLDDTAKLHPRLQINEIMNEQEQLAFAGTSTLNPMQSSVFQMAFHHRDNLLICAPTGAGKTNVAMLTIVAHFRDVGLIGRQQQHQQQQSGGRTRGSCGATTNTTTTETGHKVVYIAPMKALAQEVVEKFASKLKALKLIVRELTGDMQLTRAEADSANIIVTTPEKWDVVTRKSGTHDNSLGNTCGLLIIDEVHLLADERGAVIESVVARLHRVIESRQVSTRIVALSATLPNYMDVAEFLQVPLHRGVFYFGPQHRPVPLEQSFYGVTVPSKDRHVKEQKMNSICFDVVLDSLRRGYQVMVFVHSRKGTGDTAMALAELATTAGVLERFFCTQGQENEHGLAHKRHAPHVAKSRNAQVRNHFNHGMGIHHAGILRSDRKLTEQMFNDGAIKVLCCTATLAWGINLPAHSVVIKGTDVYNAEKGTSVDLSILDVQQIFGRAGRPQFDTSGEATLITTQEAFQRYMDKLVRAVPIESNFTKQLADHLNAEVVGGTVTNLREGAAWLTYTYMYIRMLKNPIAYGISADQKADDPTLKQKCLELVTQAAQLLDEYKMVRFNRDSGNLAVVSQGRVAAHYYIQAESVATFNEMLERTGSVDDAFLLRVICAATEFRNMKVRQEELSELASLHAKSCPMPIEGAGKNASGQAFITGPEDKAFILMQAYISRARINSFTLVSDTNYIASSAGRVARALFEMTLVGGSAVQARKLLRIAKSVDNQLWWFQTPLRQFGTELKEANYSGIELFHGGSGYDTFAAALSLLDMQANEVGDLAKWRQGGAMIQRFVRMLPQLEIEYKVQPLTSGLILLHVELTPTFEWHGRWHGGAQSFWLLIEDGFNGRIYHHENIRFTHKKLEPVVLDLKIPTFDSSRQYLIQVMSDSWVAVEAVLPVPLQDIEMPREKTPWTRLQDLTPLPTSALNDPKYEQIYSKYGAFNPIQTQLFHVVYHTDTPIFLGAPTGSGKTIVAELGLLRMKRFHPNGICVYIAPLKSLARERLKDWKSRFGKSSLGWQVLELSGDTHHDQSALKRADILVCTPEKWDLISRGWRGSAESAEGSIASNGKAFVKRVKLLVIDEIHLVGEERGAVLEAIVSRTRFISRVLKQEENGAGDSSDMEATRIIGLSTALENPMDIADWIGIDTKSHKPTARRGLFNFESSVRPVPTTVHVQGFSGRHYCPRMATMNKPCFAAIKDYSPDRPSLIFVASRRQTRLTAFDIISYAAAEENPKRFLGCSETYIESIAQQLSDEALRHTITFGIGLHHAGLSSHDREIVETLYLSGDIRVLVATATLAWGVNLPARLVIVKGTEFFDGKVSRYVDYPLTDVLQMIGRAGRPGFDTEGYAVVMCVEEKKIFYKKFLYIPFPLESCLGERLCENINAEICGGTIASTIEAVGYLTWTFYARRVKANPSYYGAESRSDEHVEMHLLTVAKATLESLYESGCITYDKDDPDDSALVANSLGFASSNYYLTYRTPKQMQFGVRKARKIVLKAIDDFGNSAGATGTNSSCSSVLMPLIRHERVDEISSAWLLYTLCSTHEFDELPVRHNEEQLNMELSEQLMWGPDTQVLLSEKGWVHYNEATFEDPHTKAFLLMQAYLLHARLPISDYVNDTKSIVDNVPRLLAAMEFIAMDDSSAAGSFELITQFARVRQLFETRTIVYDSPLVQLELKRDVIDSMMNGAKNRKDAVRTIAGLRALPRKEALSLLQKLSQGFRKGTSNDHPFRSALDKLYSIPLFALKTAVVVQEVEKASGKTTGKLKLCFEIERDQAKSTSDRSNQNEQQQQQQQPLQVDVLLGSHRQRMMLAKSTMTISHFGKWTVNKELSFDWDAANADGGTEGGGGKAVILRLMLDKFRGFDLETTIALS